MLKIHLKDAYYSVKILEEHSKYLKFSAGSKLLKFEVLPIWIVFRFKISHKTHRALYSSLKIGGNHYNYLHRRPYNIRGDI